MDDYIDEPYKIMKGQHRVARHSLLEIDARYQNDPDLDKIPIIYRRYNVIWL